MALNQPLGVNIPQKVLLEIEEVLELEGFYCLNFVLSGEDSFEEVVEMVGEQVVGF